MLKPHVIIATKGRPLETKVILEALGSQSLKPAEVIVVGTDETDVAEARFANCEFEVRFILNEPGASKQRNRGVDELAIGNAEASSSGSFIAFFDDDFRLADDWLEKAAYTFSADSGIVGLTGQILADGIKGPGLSEQDAADYLTGKNAPEKHWATGSEMRDIDSVYGCNMAFRTGVVDGCRFDENLPLYSWQEDRDFTSQARKIGRVVYQPTCRGVHLGVKRGRQSGLKLGYSQIANPIYLAKKGTATNAWKRKLLLRALAANTIYSVSPPSYTDYRGRLAGNFLAIRDLITGGCRPDRILNL
ncbi:MAG: glycosyltransferase [Pseudomonadota bacterium]